MCTNEYFGVFKVCDEEVHSAASLMFGDVEPPDGQAVYTCRG